MSKVIIYSTPTCIYCKMTKQFLDENNVEYTDYNIAEDADKRQEMVDRSGQMGVPVIDIDGKLFVGFEKEKISEALGLK